MALTAAGGTAEGCRHVKKAGHTRPSRCARCVRDRTDALRGARDIATAVSLKPWSRCHVGIVSNFALRRESGRLVSEMLQVLGYASDTAASGLEAVEYCQRFRPAAVLMDVQMPGMSGIEATQRLRRMEAHGRCEALHIIGAATQNDEETREACMLAGMNGFLHKPLGLWNLAHQIGTAVPGAA